MDEGRSLVDRANLVGVYIEPFVALEQFPLCYVLPAVETECKGTFPGQWMQGIVAELESGRSLELSWLSA